MRELDEIYLDFYCSPSGNEGTISDRVAAAMADLGWHGLGHGSELRLVDFRTGTRKVWRDGAWVDEERDADDG